MLDINLQSLPAAPVPFRASVVDQSRVAAGEASHMRRIPLIGGLFAIIDDIDYGWLCQYKWRVWRNRHGRMYAMRRIWTEQGTRHTVYMHRSILRPPVGMCCDHINGDGLDNRRCNLRPATASLNAKNVRASKTSRYGLPMGVRGAANRRKFEAHIRIDGEYHHLGTFATPGAAHAVYLAAKEASVANAARDAMRQYIDAESPRLQITVTEVGQ